MLIFDSSLPVYTLAGAACVLSLLIRWRNREKLLPPGPQRLPLLGSALHVPTKLTAEYLMDLGERHSKSFT
jgi:hypothetical protein